MAWQIGSKPMCLDSCGYPYPHVAWTKKACLALPSLPGKIAQPGEISGNVPKFRVEDLVCLVES